MIINSIVSSKDDRLVIENVYVPDNYTGSTEVNTKVIINPIEFLSDIQANQEWFVWNLMDNAFLANYSYTGLATGKIGVDNLGNKYMEVMSVQNLQEVLGLGYEVKVGTSISDPGLIEIDWGKYRENGSYKKYPGGEVTLANNVVGDKDYLLKLYVADVNNDNNLTAILVKNIPSYQSQKYLTEIALDPSFGYIIGEGETSGLEHTINPGSETIDINFDTVGDPTFIDGIVTGFSTSSYLRTSRPINSGTNDYFEMIIAFTPDAFGEVQYIVSGPAYNTPRLTIGSQGNLIVSYSEDGTSFNDLTSNGSLTPGKKYWAKFTWDKGTYSLKLSTDGILYDPLASAPGTSFKARDVMYLGGNPDNAFTFTGALDLNNISITDGVGVWTPYTDDAGSVTITEGWDYSDDPKFYLPETKTKTLEQLLGTQDAQVNMGLYLYNQSDKISDFGLFNSIPTNYTPNTGVIVEEGVVSSTTSSPRPLIDMDNGTKAFSWPDAFEICVRVRPTSMDTFYVFNSNRISNGGLLFGFDNNQLAPAAYIATTPNGPTDIIMYSTTYGLSLNRWNWARFTRDTSGIYKIDISINQDSIYPVEDEWVNVATTAANQAKPAEYPVDEYMLAWGNTFTQSGTFELDLNNCFIKDLTTNKIIIQPGERESKKIADIRLSNDLFYIVG